MSRREFPAKIKVAAFKRAAGCCESCTAKLVPGHTHYDHVVPDALGGEPTLENCACICSACHGAKTAGIDIPAIAKARRQEARYIGAKAKSRRSFATNRDGPFKQKLSGETVRRER